MFAKHLQKIIEIQILLLYLGWEINYKIFLFCGQMC